MASLLMEVLDMCGDSYVLFHYVIPDSGLSDLVAPWVCAYALACCVSLINLIIKAKLLVKQVRSRRTELQLGQEDELGVKQARLAKNQKRLKSANTKIHKIYAGLLVCFGESLPMGILQLVKAQRSPEMSLLEDLCMLQSWGLVFVKLSKVFDLHKLFKRKQKQQKKTKPATHAMLLSENTQKMSVEMDSTNKW